MQCGIDFGTSNTAMAVRGADGFPRLIPLEGGHTTLPTALFFTEKNRDIFFGRKAVAAYLDGQEGRFMRSMKRVLGTSLMDGPILVNGQRTTFDFIIGRFLSHIKQTAEESLGHVLSDVTIGRPVHFQNNDPDADNRAEEQLHRVAQQVGFKNVQFRYEPIAAALAHEQAVQGEKLALVVDIGGGTSDFSIIRLSSTFAAGRDRKQDILVNKGIRIGGNDCDKAINLEVMMPLLGMGSQYGDKNLDMPVLLYHELSEWAKVNWCYTPQHINNVRYIQREAHEPEKLENLEAVLEMQLGHKILDVTETMKIALTTQDDHMAQLDFIQRDLSVSLRQERMNRLLDDVLEPVCRMMLDTVSKAGLASQDIDVIVLTGGSTGLPVFMHWLARYFPHAEILQENRLASVGLGLAL